MAVEQLPITPTEALINVHRYYNKDHNPLERKVPNGYLISVLVLQRYQDQPEVADYLNKVSPWFGARVMRDLVNSDAAADKVPVSKANINHIETALMVADALSLDDVVKYQSKLAQLRQKYHIERVAPEDEFVQAVVKKSSPPTKSSSSATAKPTTRPTTDISTSREVITLGQEAMGTAPKELLTRINQVLSESNSAEISLQTTPKAILDYLASIDLPAGARLIKPAPTINGPRLSITGAISTAIGNAEFGVTFVQEPGTKLKVTGVPVIKVDWGLGLALKAKGMDLNKMITNLDQMATEQLGKRIDQNWEITALRISEGMLAFDLRRKAPSKPSIQPTSSSDLPAPASTEHSRSNELIQQALNSGISLIEAYTPEGEKVLQENNDHRLQVSRERLFAGLDCAFLNREHRIPKILQQAGIFEAAVIAPLEKTETKEVVDKEGFLGRGRKTHQESYNVPVIIDEELGRESNNSQQAISIYYYAHDSDTFIFEERAFTDRVGRFGNILKAEIVLPPEIGKNIAEEIKRNPKFIRELVEAFVRNKYHKSFIQDSWNRYARPPYQAWDSRPADRRKFYFADLVSHPEDKHLTAEQAINKAVPY